MFETIFGGGAAVVLVAVFAFVLAATLLLVGLATLWKGIKKVAKASHKFVMANQTTKVITISAAVLLTGLIFGVKLGIVAFVVAVALAMVYFASLLPAEQASA